LSELATAWISNIVIKMLRDDVIGLHYSWQLILTKSIRD